MADAGKRWYGPAQPDAAVAADLFTVTGGHKGHVTNITIANTTSTDATLTLSIGADAAAKRIVSAMNVPANGVIVLNGYWYIDGAEKMQGFQGTASALTVTISGVDET